MSQRPWTVLRHGPLEKLAPNLWSVQGQSTAGALKRRMTLIRLMDGRVVVFSAIPLEASAMEEVEAWGTPAFIVVPNGYHRLDAPAYKERYPKAEVVCPEVWRDRVAKVVPVEGTLDRLPTGDTTLRWSEVGGTARREIALEVTSNGHRSLILNDVLFNHPHRRGFGGAVLKLIGSTGGPKVTPIGRTFLMKDKSALRAQFETWAALPLSRVIVSHVDIIDENVAEVLRNVAATL